MGCTSCTDTTPCGTPDCGCKFEVDAGCVRYSGESLGAAGFVEGDTLDTILKTINSNMEAYGPGDYVEVETEAAGENCTYGGVKIILRDGDDNSIKSTNYICGVANDLALNGSGTLNTLAMWTPNGITLGNSMISQSDGVLTIGGVTKITGGSPGTNKAFLSSSDGTGSWVSLNASHITGVVKQDGTTPLTSDWNVGSYEITSNKFIGNNGFGFNVGLGGSLVSASTTGSSKTWTLPNTTGTVALISDIPSLVGYLKADGTVPLTADWNAGSYTFTTNKVVSSIDATVNGLTVGKGGSSIATNTALGVNALAGITNGFNNVSIGYQALSTNTTGDYNVAIGYQASKSGSFQNRTIAIGYQALYNTDSSDGNVGIGHNAMSFNTVGDQSVAVGHQSMYSNTTGSYNTALGYKSSYANATGSYNTALGDQSLQNNTSSYNTAVGHNALFNTTTGTQNTALGVAALFNNTTGSGNTALGYKAGEYLYDAVTLNTTSSNSVFLGTEVKSGGAGSTNENVLGYAAIGNGSNTTTIGNTQTANIYLHGDLNLKNTSSVQVASLSSNRYLLVTINGTSYKLLLAA